MLQDNVDFDIDVNASVFETNIRGEGSSEGLEENVVWRSHCAKKEGVKRLLMIYPTWHGTS